MPRLHRRRVLAALVLRLALLPGAGFGVRPMLPAQPAGSYSLVLGPEELVLPLGQHGLQFTPDGHLPYVRNPDGTARVFWACGTTAGSGMTVAMDTADFLTFRPVVSRGGNAVAVFQPSGVGTTNFDGDYSGPGTVMRAANGTDLLMFYHAENNLFAGVHTPFVPFYASIGLARSTDHGVTWIRQGQILTGMTPHPPGPSPRDALGAASPCVIAINSYLYLFYVDLRYQAGPDVIHLARAPLASDGAPGSWQKWHHGAFSEPGLGGQSTPVHGQVAPGPVTVNAGHPSVSFNTFLQSYVLVFQTKDGFYYSMSSDLTSWTVQERILAFGNTNNGPVRGEAWLAYPTLLSLEQPTDQATSQSGYLYYAKGVWEQSSHTMHRRAFRFTAPVAPTIVGQPQSRTVDVRANPGFTVNAYGPDLTYQWTFNGAPIPGATQATLTLAAVGLNSAGSYAAVVANAGGSVTSAPATLVVRASRLVNLSTRGLVPAGGALTPGFVMRGTGEKRLVIRAVGPTLGAFGIGGALSDPALEVLPQGGTTPRFANDDWGGAAELSAEFAAVGAFALPVGSTDAAVLATLGLAPGGYTVRIAARGNAAGIALAEIYDADPDGAPATLANVSTLGFAGAGEQTLAVGFAIRGMLPKRLLIRAVGPGLGQFNIGGIMDDPRLNVVRQADSVVVGANNDWGGGATLKAAFTSAGAFLLAEDSADAALLITLAPGTYSVGIASMSGTGQVLVEVYDLD